jgi:hypothetical protein
VRVEGVLPLTRQQKLTYFNRMVKERRVSVSCFLNRFFERARKFSERATRYCPLTCAKSRRL